MTAGKGVLHSEMFPLLNEDENPLELFQIWLNHPQNKRDVDPHYKMFWKDDIPVVDRDGARITVISGFYGTTIALTPSPDSWAVNPQNDVQVWRIELQSSSSFEIPVANIELNRSLFFFGGSTALIGNHEIHSHHGLELKTGEKIIVKNNGKETAYFLFLQGRPINEDFVRNGPFIAANRNEMRKVISEYQRTQFGGWHWDEPGPVFGPEKKRFSTLS